MKEKIRHDLNSEWVSFKIAAIYAVFSSIWILLSDQILYFLVKDPEVMTKIQMAKGWAFILTSAMIIFFLLRREINKYLLAEKALRASHERFLTVLNSIDATIYVADMETHKILFVNKYMIETFGRDLTGETCWSAFKNEPDPCPNCTVENLIDENGTPTGVCVWQEKNPVTGRWYSNYDRAIEWTDGRLVKIQIAIDITDFKKMEEELRQAHKMESIGTLAGGVAHDFNNLLGIIIGNVELALDDMPFEIAGRKYIKEIQTASLRAKDVVKQLLSFSRKTESEKKPLDVGMVIKESLKLIRSSIPSNIEINEKVPETCNTILADRTQIHQVIINLATNASHAMSGGGGVLEVIANNVVMDRETGEKFKNMAPGKYLELIVKDTGTGMDFETREKMFDPYFTTKDIGKGTGIGLSVVHGIVKNHDGFMHVDSEPGKGTAFTIFFPITEVQPDNKISEVTMEDRPIGTEKILFVDDEKAIVDMVSLQLKKLGYKLEAYLSPLEALKIFKTNPNHFDLVISDMTMPQMNGLDLSKKIRKIRPDIPIVICTGNSSLVDEGEAKTIGISAYAVKPISMSKIAKILREVLDK